MERCEGEHTPVEQRVRRDGGQKTVGKEGWALLQLKGLSKDQSVCERAHACALIGRVYFFLRLHVYLYTKVIVSVLYCENLHVSCLMRTPQSSENGCLGIVILHLDHFLKKQYFLSIFFFLLKWICVRRGGKRDIVA